MPTRCASLALLMVSDMYLQRDQRDQRDQATGCRYRFYKPTTWFNAPKTAKYTRYDPNWKQGADSEGPGARANVSTSQTKVGQLSVWHGSLRRWRKCDVDACRIGAPLDNESQQVHSL
jgi:hypothetical protein